MSIVNTTHAGELFLKAIIAQEHPLLIFKDLFALDYSRTELLDLASLIRRGRTHDFDKLPQILWATTGQRLPNMECFERVRRARNAVQHFCAPEETDLRGLSLEFIYTVIDPLIAREFDMRAIEFHEDHYIGYDYVVACLLRRQLRFTLPDDFDVREIDISEELTGAEDSYRLWLSEELNRLGKSHLLLPRDRT